MVLTVLPPTAAFLLAALAVRLLPRRAGTAAGSLLVGLTLPWMLFVPAGTHVPVTFAGFETALFVVDGLARPVALVLAFVTLANVLYAHGSGTPRPQVALAVVYAGAGLGAVLAADWLSLLVHWELLAICATVLLWAGDDVARRAGLRYALYHAVGGGCLTLAVLARYATAGSFAFAGGWDGWLAVLAAVGIGVNVGFVGLHVWIPDAYPTPDVAISAVLAGVTTKVGVYALVRATPEPSLLVAYLGAAMLVVGVTYAILQTDVRRLLSYHIVSQVGYMVAAAGLASELARAGAVGHLLNNVLYKTLLFMVAGVLVLRTGREGLKSFHGVGRRMPLVTVAFLVAALAITGVPGFAGYVSKAVVVDAAGKAGEPLLRWTLSLGGVGTVVSFAKVGYYAFAHTDGETPADAPDATPTQALAMGLLAVPCVAFGLVPGFLTGLLPGTVSTSLLATAKLTETVAILVVGLVGFLVLRGPLARLPALSDLEVFYEPAGRAVWRAVPRATANAGAAVESGYARATEQVSAVASAPPDRSTPLGTGVLVLVVLLALFVGWALLG